MERAADRSSGHGSSFDRVFGKIPLGYEADGYGDEMPDEPIPEIHPLLTTEKTRKREASRRKKHHDVISVTPGAVEDYVKNGWELDKKLKRKVRLRRNKSRDEKLENRLWYLLYKLGFTELNQGRSFTMMVERRGTQPLRKQIDVFARDEETVIVAECKASATPKRRSLQKDLEEFGSLKGPISKTINRYYGKSLKPKILWLFVTENIIWSSQDKTRADGHRISDVLPENWSSEKVRFRVD